MSGTITWDSEERKANSNKRTDVINKTGPV